ncbi:uncharacterized protein LOC134188081 isoform X2 [Corticium candelabrum]|nr:uncharacterized protein LOC134188081 isoform X2 [Corticium candelabrum]
MSQKVTNVTQSHPASVDLIEVNADGVFYKRESLWLYVPPGAVSDRQEISARFLVDKQSMPLADTSQNWYIFSPVLELEPHGLYFHKPIQIKLPVTAIFQGWDLVLLRADCHASETPKTWKEVLSIDTDSRQVSTQDEHCSYNQDMAILQVSHFCKYCWCGRPKDGAERSEKTVDCLLFAQINSWGKRVNFILHFSDLCYDVYKLIIKKEAAKTPAYHLVDCTSIPIGLKGDLKIEVSASNFDIENDDKIIPASDMWKVQFGPQKRILFSAKLKNCVVDKTEDPQLLLELTTDDQSEKLRASFALSGDQRLIMMDIPDSDSRRCSSKSSRSSGRGSFTDGDHALSEVVVPRGAFSEVEDRMTSEVRSVCESTSSASPNSSNSSKTVFVIEGNVICGDRNQMSLTSTPTSAIASPSDACSMDVETPNCIQKFLTENDEQSQS